MKTIADRYIHAAYHNKHWWQAFWIYQHRWSWTTLNPPFRSSMLINLQPFSRGELVHISTVNCDEMARDRPRQPVRVNFSSQSPDPLGSRKPAQAGVKDSYLLKSGYFTAIISCSVKTVADRHRHAVYRNKQKWQAFYWCQRRWPWMTLNPQNRVLVIFLRFSAVTHILKVNCAKMAGDGPG